MAGAVVGCGKKGPPLTPIVRIPDTVEAVAARRLGDDVHLTMMLPRQNIDGSMPASLVRVDVYAATSMTAPPRARFLEIAALVGSIPVQRAADPANPDEVLPPPDPKSGAVQGTTAAFVDTLTDDERIPQELPVLESERRQAARPGTVAVTPVRALRRFYMAIPIGPRERNGPPSAIVELPLTPLPDPPAGLRAGRQAAVALTGDTLTLEWEPAGGLVGWLIDRALPVERAPFPEPPARAGAPPVPSSDLPPGPTQYNVYRQIAPDPLVLPDPAAAVMPWDRPAPAPVNAAPLAVLTYSEPVQLDGRPRCYRVRSVRGTGAQRVESEASEPVCITPVDTTPPVTPTNLQAILGEGQIALLWEPNVEQDLGGFIVLRRDDAGATLTLTPAPITQTRFTDSTVTPGMRYTYEVHAVDTRIPLPNISPAAVVSETAR